MTSATAFTCTVAVMPMLVMATNAFRHTRLPQPLGVNGWIVALALGGFGVWQMVGAAMSDVMRRDRDP